MKKALALVLALVLALSLGVSAFALEVVDLEPVPETPAKKIAITNTLLPDTVVDTVGVTYLAPAKGGDFYFEIEDYANLKNITVTANGSVSAEIVKFDGSKMTMDGVNFYVAGPDGVMAWANCTTTEAEKTAAKYPCGTYEYALACVKEMNNAEKISAKYSVVPGTEDTEGVHPIEVNLLKVTVAPNYSASYKTGSFKLTATRKSDKAAVAYSANIVSDVTVFEYEMVKWSGLYEEALVVGDEGYSLYKFEGAYSAHGDKYDYTYLREDGSHATVISTTEFRVLRENKWGALVQAGNMLVSVPEIASSQKGVNFAFHDVKYNPVTNAVEFGFYGDQVIASDFTITVDLHETAFSLRELFGEAVEEEDIITYYVLKNGKVADSFVVDYMKDEIDEDLVLEIAGKAGSTLGDYEIVTEAPVAPSEGEENPNTGAESVIGVVAAMAVVSVAAAAAVSLKK